MTCRHALSLLEDYMDNNLASSAASEVKAHLESCPECRGEYQETLRLKELLKTPAVSTVSDSYWSEVSSLIAAKTVEADTTLPVRSPSITRISSDRRELFRSAMATLPWIAQESAIQQFQQSPVSDSGSSHTAGVRGR
jgi:anti-sigma factor RsiW